MFDRQQLRCVMEVQLPLLLSQTVQYRRWLLRMRSSRLGEDLHPVGGSSAAGPNQAAVHFHHTGVTSLHRTELRVVADVGYRDSRAVDQIDEKLVGLGCMSDAVDCNVGHSFLSTPRIASPVPVVRESALPPSERNTTTKADALRLSGPLYAS